MNNTLFISDLDRTLLNKNQEIHIDCKKFIKTYVDQGGLFSIATARSLNSAQQYIEELELQLPVILFNGAQVYCPINKEYLYSLNLPLNSMQILIDAMKVFELNPFVHVIDSNNELKVYFQNVSNQGEMDYLNSRWEAGDCRFRLTQSYQTLSNIKCIEVLTIGKEDNIRGYYEFIKDNLSDHDLKVYLAQDMYHSRHFWLEVTHEHASKAHGVSYLKQHTSAQKSICFGDNTNDLSMIEHCDIGIAVANAIDEVKYSAQLVLEHSHEQRAVTTYIQNYWKDRS